MRFYKLPKAQQWDSRAPWRHGEKRGDQNERGGWTLTHGRWQLGVSWRYCGDTYGHVGADSWRLYVTAARDPITAPRSGAPKDVSLWREAA